VHLQPISVPQLDVEPHDLLSAAVRHRVTGILHARAAELDLRGRFGPEVVAWLARVHDAESRGVCVQALELQRILAAFANAGVRALVLKGPALAVQTAGYADARGVGDLDLFVAPESVEVAREVLAAEGWLPRTFGSATPGSWAWRHVLRTFNEITFDGRASTVDLHWRLDPTPGALPDFAECWERRALVRLNDTVEVPTLSLRDAFVHSCWHAAKDEWRWLRSVVDVHRLARMPGTWVRWEEFAGWHVRQTIAVTDDLVGLPAAVPAELRRLAAQERSAVRRARSRQAGPPVARRPFPAARSLHNLRHRLRADHRPRAVGLVLSAAAIPAYSVAGIDDRSAWVAVPKLVVRRLVMLVRWARTWFTGAPSPFPSTALEPAPVPGEAPRRAAV
jgi:hypothetical protein